MAKRATLSKDNRQPQITAQQHPKDACLHDDEDFLLENYNLWNLNYCLDNSRYLNTSLVELSIFHYFLTFYKTILNRNRLKYH